MRTTSAINRSSASYRLCGVAILILTSVASLAFPSNDISAQEFQWDLIAPVPQPTCPTHPSPDCYWYGQGPVTQPSLQLHPTFLIKNISSTFSLDTNAWTFTAVLGDNPDTAGDIIPDSFWMVLNHGPMPGGPGGYSMFYFDGTDGQNPKLSVYAYNGSHALFDESWADGSSAAGTQAPDRICNSITPGGCGNWVSSIVVEDLPSGDRLFSFEVDASPILSHTPLYGSPSLWHRRTDGGTPRIFDQGVGIWLHLGLGRQYAYDTDGFITAIDEAQFAGYYDAALLSSNQKPECESTISVVETRPGELVEFTITGTDADSPTAPTAVLSGDLPPIMCSQSTTPGNATQVSCSLTAPAVPNPTSYSVNVEFTDDGGTSTSCAAQVTVINSAPVCTVTVNGPSGPLACQGALTNVSISLIASDQNLDPIQVTPTIQCSTGNASIIAQGMSTLVASVDAPGLGIQTSCVVTVNLSDGFVPGSCQTTFMVDPCDLDCLSIPNGTAQIDDCGVCNGTNACFDCADVPFGTASEDRCGVCLGDGLSCLDCSPINNTAAQLSLDNSAAALREITRSGLSQLRRISSDSRSHRRFAERIRNQSNDAYERAWAAIWTIQSIGQICSNDFCVTISDTQSVVSFDAAVADLNTALSAVAKRLGRVGAPKRKLRLEQRQARANAEIAAEQANLITSISTC